jgi:hypothetical protein
MKFSELKNGDLFMCGGSEYVKVCEHGAIMVSPEVTRFSGCEQVAKSRQSSTTVGNWKYAKDGVSIEQATV